MHYTGHRCLLGNSLSKPHHKVKSWMKRWPKSGLDWDHPVMTVTLSMSLFLSKLLHQVRNQRPDEKCSLTVLPYALEKDTLLQVMHSALKK